MATANKVTVNPADPIPAPAKQSADSAQQLADPAPAQKLADPAPAPAQKPADPAPPLPVSRWDKVQALGQALGEGVLEKGINFMSGIKGKLDHVNEGERESPLAKAKERLKSATGSEAILNSTMDMILVISKAVTEQLGSQFKQARGALYDNMFDGIKNKLFGSQAAAPAAPAAPAANVAPNVAPDVAPKTDGAPVAPSPSPSADALAALTEVQKQDAAKQVSPAQSPDSLTPNIPS